MIHANRETTTYLAIQILCGFHLTALNRLKHVASGVIYPPCVLFACQAAGMASRFFLAGYYLLEDLQIFYNPAYIRLRSPTSKTLSMQRDSTGNF
jgi:hypothetical protein